MDQQKSLAYKYMLIALVISLLLSRVALGSLFFAIPILLVYQMLKDKKAILGLLLVDLVAVVTFAFIDLKGNVSPSFLAIGLYFPLTLILGSFLWILLDGKHLYPIWRFVFSTSSILLCSIFAYFVISKNTESHETIKTVFLSMFQLDILGVDPEILFTVMVDFVKRSFFAMAVFLLGFNIAISEMINHRRDNEWKTRVSNFKIDVDAVWFFLCSWLLIFLGSIINYPMILNVIFWNFALSISLLYAVQGFAIIANFMLKRNSQFSFGKLIWLLILLAFLPGVNFVVVFLLPILGVLETWVDFKRY